MNYSIKEVSEKTKLTSYTIRYYEKSGLLPNITRKENGVRIFHEDDILWIEVIKCLKETGMKLGDIKSIVDLSLLGDSTKEKRKSIFIDHRSKILNQIQALQNNLEKINLKIKIYS